MTESNLVKLTGLWKKKDKQGNLYLAGKVSPSSRILVLINSRKRSEAEPDYNCFLAPAEEREERQPQAEPTGL